MAKKSVSKAVNNVSKQLKSIFDTHNILSSIIVVLLVVYMSFVNSSNVPRLFNNVIVKLVLLGLVAYTFFQDKLVAVFLGITVILSISLANRHKAFVPESNTILDEEESITQTPNQELPPVIEESYESLGTNLEVSSSNPYIEHGPSGVASGGLNISTHRQV